MELKKSIKLFSIRLRKNSRGFSLIELMIVVAIIGILSIIAIPSYQQYTKKARFAEIISISHFFKTAVALAIQQGAALQELNNGNPVLPPLPKSTKNLASLSIDKGAITAVATELVDGVSYILKPNGDGSHWNVSGTCIKTGLCNA